MLLAQEKGRAVWALLGHPAYIPEGHSCWIPNLVNVSTTKEPQPGTETEPLPDPEEPDAETDEAGVDSSTPQVGSRKRQRPSKSRALTQEELDARHPGNARNRAAIQVVSSAFQAFAAWRHRCAGTVVASTSGTATEQLLQRWAQPPATAALQDQVRMTGKGEQQQTDASDKELGNNQPQPAADWVALFHMRHTLKPKLTMEPCTCQQGCSVSNLVGSVARNPCTKHQVVADAGGTPVVLPPGSGFLMCDVTAKGALQPLLSQGVDHKYHLIVMDPPWENASARRRGSYATLPARQLLRLPVGDLLHEDGVVLLWITNRERLHRCVHEELLPAWDLEHTATWYWLKLRPGSVEPVSSLSSMHRHPFEPILVLRPKGGAPRRGTGQLQSQPSPAAAPLSTGQTPEPIPGGTVGCSSREGRDVVGDSDGLVLLSVPPQEHSRKPFLGGIAARVLKGLTSQHHEPEGPGSCHSAGGAPDPRRGSAVRVTTLHESTPQLRGLEVFGRELRPGWDVVGNEVLAFQELRLFKQPQAAST